ncbi:hypothetical protein [Pseudonocardia abyssalis]|nr:hypothetical protein [Pseudonocardia abyssalis]
MTVADHHRGRGEPRHQLDQLRDVRVEGDRAVGFGIGGRGPARRA